MRTEWVDGRVGICRGSSSGEGAGDARGVRRDGAVDASVGEGETAVDGTACLDRAATGWTRRTFTLSPGMSLATGATAARATARGALAVTRTVLPTATGGGSGDGGQSGAAVAGGGDL